MKRYMSAAALGGLLVTLGCGGDAEAGAASAAADSGYVRVVNVQTRTVRAEPFTELIRLTGVVHANQDVVLSAEESGVIERIFVERGAMVGQGDPLFKIQDRVLTAEVEQARAQAELARESWERRKRLWEEDQVGSEIAYLEARYAAEQAAARLEALEERLARTVIRAPFAGVLEDRRVEVGTMVQPGVAVGRLVDITPVKVVAGVPERYSQDVQSGDRAAVTFDVMQDREFEGSITFVGATVDPQSRTFPIEVTLSNDVGRIKPEMVANVGVVRRELEGAVVVPQSALVRVDDGFVVFVVESRQGSEVAVARPVRRGAAQRNLVVIEEGLSVGERLVVVGQTEVADGDRVNVVQGSEEQGEG